MIKDKEDFDKESQPLLNILEEIDNPEREIPTTIASDPIKALREDISSFFIDQTNSSKKHENLLNKIISKMENYIETHPELSLEELQKLYEIVSSKSYSSASKILQLFMPQANTPKSLLEKVIENDMILQNSQGVSKNELTSEQLQVFEKMGRFFEQIIKKS